jgi:rhodanese-related sulfurtransferase
MIVREKKLKFQTLALLIIITIIAVYFFTLNSQESVEDEVTVEQVRAMIDNADSIVFLDVRREYEFKGSQGHLEGAILIPLSELKSRIEEMEIYRDQKIIVYCLAGFRSNSASRILRENGFNAVNMKGGMLAWNKMMKSVMKDSTEVKQ